MMKQRVFNTVFYLVLAFITGFMFYSCTVTPKSTRSAGIFPFAENLNEK